MLIAPTIRRLSQLRSSEKEDAGADGRPSLAASAGVDGGLDGEGRPPMPLFEFGMPTGFDLTYGQGVTGSPVRKSMFTVYEEGRIRPLQRFPRCWTQRGWGHASSP